MTTLVNRPNSALLVVDMQNGVVGEAYDRDSIVANIKTLLDKARAADVDVVWVQHNSEELPHGSESWHYVPELVRRDGEALVQKAYGDAFEETDLESVLAAHGIGQLFLAGAQTDECIRSTLHGAMVRGYDVDSGRRRAHNRGPLAVRCSTAGQGDRPHQPVLAVPPGSWPEGWNGQHRRRRLRGGLGRLTKARSTSSEARPWHSFAGRQLERR